MCLTISNADSVVINFICCDDITSDHVIPAKDPIQFQYAYWLGFVYANINTDLE
jgi:hypothetical protein